MSVPVNIVLVGKYTEFEDSYASVTKALRHAAGFCERKLVLKYVDAEELEDEAVNPIKYHEAWKELCAAK